MAFKWDKLLSCKRRRRTNKSPEDKRSEFERDYDRLVTSSALRRLQDKTQVFPLEHHDFVRTRLTHSLEVSAYGRSFGAEVVRRLPKQSLEKLTAPDTDIRSVLSTVCLAHDIGNPPFGHFGETAIRSWFESWFKKAENKRGLSKSQQKDFLNFEGNAQGLRILTYLQSLNDDKGVNFTYGTLGSYLKYTASSLEVDAKAERKSRRKVGYFTSERDVFEEIQSVTSLNKARHPLAFLMEAADDIANSTTDLEDALKKGMVDFDTLVETLESKLKGTSYFSLLENKDKKERDKKGLKDIYAKRKKEGWSAREAAQIAIVNFRIAVVGILFLSCAKSFSEKYDTIMEGDFDEELIAKCDSSILCSALKDIVGTYVYSSQSVLTLEVIGNQVIHSLLDMFVNAVISDDREDSKTLNGKLFQLISSSLRELNRIHGNKSNNRYDQLQLVTDFVCGMTDTYALNLYQRLKGMQFDLG